MTEGSTRGTSPLTDEACGADAKVREGYVAFVEELPRANKQGETLEAARASTEEALKGQELSREPLPDARSGAT